jgi:hypothetical protein
MTPLPVYPTTPTAPAPVAMPPLRVRVRHQVKQVFKHFPGVERGSLVYLNLNGYGWYAGSAGFETRPGPGAKIGRYLRGLEDSDERKVR